MKLINYGDTSLLLGDDMADLLLEYSVLLARSGSADSTSVNALDVNGAELHLHILIGPATMMTASEAESEFAAPDNTAALSEVREKIAAIVTPPSVLPSDPDVTIGEFDDV